MSTTKEYGLLSLNQLRQTVSFIDQLNEIKILLQQAIQENPEKLKTLSPPFYWTEIYEKTFREHTLAFTFITGMLPQLEEALQSEDIAQAMLDIPIDQDSLELVDCPLEEVEEKHVIGLYFSFVRSIDCMNIYNKHLHELIVDVRNGDDSALFKAVQIDRSIVSSPTIADRITLAEIEQDDEFFVALSKAIQRIKPKMPTEAYSKLRYVLYMLEQAQVLDQLSIEDEYRLFCEELKIYPDDGEDPAKSLHQFISRWKQARST